MCDSNNVYISLVYEDQIHGVVLSKILPAKFTIASPMQLGGRSKIESKISGFNNACHSHPFFVLMDLDTDACASSLISNLLPQGQHPNLIFRIAVHEVEAWLLADGEAFSRHTGISVANIPPNPDELPDPKQTLINLVRAKARKSIKDAIVPKPGSTAPIGRAYNDELSKYVQLLWRPEVAREHSPSLNRAIAALETFRPTV
jgi:hypothetical protein